MAFNFKQAGPLLTYGIIGFGSLFLLDKCRFTVEPGHLAIKFSRLSGLKQTVYREGWHLMIPFFERPIIFNTQTRPRNFKGQTANKDMQNVILTLRVLYRPDHLHLHELYREVGLDFDERVLPSITNEVMRIVIAQYTASQLLSNRDQVSSQIRSILQERAQNFRISIDDVSITELTFGQEYLEAIQAKQIAQQEAERAQYYVEQAKDIQKSIIIKAQAESQSIELVGKAAANNPSFLDLKRIEFSKEISQIIANSQNHIMLPSDTLMINLKQQSSDSQTK